MKKSFLMAAIAAVVMFTSCSKEDNGGGIPDNGESKKVMLTIVDPNTRPGTRAEGSTVSNNATISFTSGKLFFADGNAITKVIDMKSSGAGVGDFDITSPAAQTFEIPGNSKTVYIVGNIPAAITAPVAGGNITTFIASLVDINSQMDIINGGVGKVSVYGTQPLTPSSIADIDLEATVDVAPIAARIELHKFTADLGITGYQVDGIFISNYYSKSTLSGACDAASATPPYSLINNGTEANGQAPTIYGDDTAQYPSADAGITYDFNSNGIGTLTGQVYAPTTAGKVWAYNVFAPTDNPTSVFPHVIVRFSNITGPNLTGNIQWITVSGFKKESIPGSGNYDTTVELKAGEVYKINDFTFDKDDLDVAPEIKSIKANVTVTLQTWKEVNVKPEH